MAQYATEEYWTSRYKADTKPFEWYCGYSALKDIFERHLSRAAQILYVGCGTSMLGVDLYHDGYQNILNVDWARSAVDLMSSKYATLKPMRWSVMNATSLNVPAATMDVVIDKALLDAILCADGGLESAAAVLKECRRVIKDSGIFIMVTYAHPESRMSLLKALGWTVSVDTVPKRVLSDVLVPYADDDKDAAGVYYVFVCKA